MLDNLTFLRLQLRSHGVLDPKVTEMAHGNLRIQAFRGGKPVTMDVESGTTASIEALKSAAVQFKMVLGNA